MSWHPPRHAPHGTAHGAAGVCITGDGQLVLISNDQQHWASHWRAGVEIGHWEPSFEIRDRRLVPLAEPPITSPIGLVASSTLQRGWRG